jgi:hypothetical protein
MLHGKHAATKGELHIVICEKIALIYYCFPRIYLLFLVNTLFSTGLKKAG